MQLLTCLFWSNVFSLSALINDEMLLLRDSYQVIKISFSEGYFELWVDSSHEAELPNNSLKQISWSMWLPPPCVTSSVTSFFFSVENQNVSACLFVSRTGRLSTKESRTVCKAFRLPLPENLLGGLLSKWEPTNNRSGSHCISTVVHFIQHFPRKLKSLWTRI